MFLEEGDDLRRWRPMLGLVPLLGTAQQVPRKQNVFYAQTLHGTLKPPNLGKYGILGVSGI